MTIVFTSPSLFTTPSLMSIRAVPRALFMARDTSGLCPSISMRPDSRPEITPGVPAKAVTAATSMLDTSACSRKVELASAVKAIVPL